MKEPDYVMSIMSTYDTLKANRKETSHTFKHNHDGVTREKTFKYTEVIHNHYKYQHLVDDHNGKRHSLIRVEVVWGTKWWPNRVFAFILVITEVNCQLAMKHIYGQQYDSTLHFQKHLQKH